MNKTNTENISVKTSEVLLKVDDQWLHFTNPHQVIVAQRLPDVIPALREVEQLVEVNKWHAAGFVSYEAATAFDPVLRTLPDTGFPFLWFGLYSSPREIALPEPEYPREVLNWKPTIDRATYNVAIDQIRNHIAEGRTYQVNYTMRLRTDFKNNAWSFFLNLAQSQNRHAAYIDIGRYAICSASPELFFHL